MSQTKPRVATVSGPLTGGKGWPFGSPGTIPAGHVMEEFLLSGTAVSYRPIESTPVGRDGLWSTEEGRTAPYRTRMYVVRPADPESFNGVVLVNWQNVTIGHDLGAPSRSDLAAGFAWVGVTAQRVAIDGQEGFAGMLPTTHGLGAWDGARYGSLQHPGDEFCYDLFSQAGRVVGADRPAGAPDPLGGLQPRLVLATGSSQSAMRLASYLNIAHQRDRVFDGFLLHTHWGTCPYPPDQLLLESLSPVGGGWYGASSAIRDDGGVPIFVVCSESETLHNFPVRQPDTNAFRFWEVAGAAHGSGEARAEMEAIFVRDGLGDAIPAPVEQSAVHWSYVRDAALQLLIEWVDTGQPPPGFPPIEVALGDPPQIRRDVHGNALGGIRLPDLEVPSATNTGSNDENPLAALSGSSRPFPPSRLGELYGNAEAYVKAWDDAVDILAAQKIVLPGAIEAVRARGRTLASERFPT
jgi:hypothetical protein